MGLLQTSQHHLRCALVFQHTRRQEMVHRAFCSYHLQRLWEASHHSILQCMRYVLDCTACLKFQARGLLVDHVCVVLECRPAAYLAILL